MHVVEILQDLRLGGVVVIPVVGGLERVGDAEGTG